MGKQYWIRSIGGLVASGAVALGVLASTAHADQIFIQQSGTTPAGADPNVLADTASFNVGVAGSATLQDPLLIIVGAYDGNGSPSISFSGCAVPTACPLATAGTYGLTANTASFTSGDAFDQLGLTQAGGSEGFGNWTAADLASGFAAPTSFSLYAFSIDASLTNSPISIGESGAADGSFIIALSCQDGSGTSAGCVGKKGKLNNGQVAQTVFTNTGFIDGSVPEPGSLALFAAALGLSVLAAARLRRRT